ncbi:MAG: hypothetical protein K8F31_09680 [Roseovarius sp.]|nr:hypothetical protein [Roseovarius sp.]
MTAQDRGRGGNVLVIIGRRTGSWRKILLNFVVHDEENPENPEAGKNIVRGRDSVSARLTPLRRAPNVAPMTGTAIIICCITR